jgi:DNA-directed RNA polymerase subunit N (RpoN/RPB10)
MRIIILIIIINIFCFSCGKKDSPQYKTQAEYNKKVF